MQKGIITAAAAIAGTLTLTGTAIAQTTDTVPNGSFERFTTTQKQLPTAWLTNPETENFLNQSMGMPPSPVITVARDPNAVQGTSAIRLISSADDATYLLQAIPLDTPYVASPPFQPWSLRVYYKNIVRNGPGLDTDTTVIWVLGVSPSSQLSAYGWIELPDPSSTYTPALGQLFVGLSPIDPTNYSDTVAVWLIYILVGRNDTLWLDSLTILNQTGAVYSQAPVDGGFENWRTYEFVKFDRWHGFIPIDVQGFEIMDIGIATDLVKRVDTAAGFVGNLSAKISPALFFDPDTPANFILLGTMDINTGDIKGVPLPSRRVPDTLGFAYKFQSPDTLPATAFIMLIRADSAYWDTTFYLPVSSDWTTRSVPLRQWCGCDTIDSILIAFTPNKVVNDNVFLPAPTNATLWVDGVGFRAPTPTGIEYVWVWLSADDVSATYESSSGLVRLSGWLAGAQTALLYIFDADGRLITARPLTLTDATTGTSAGKLPAGKYLYLIKWDNGRVSRGVLGWRP